MLSERTRLMVTFRGRLRLEEMDAAEASKNSVLNDAWFAPTSQLRGPVKRRGREYITSQRCLDALAVPQDEREVGAFRRLTQLMRAHGWEPVRINPDGVDVTKQARGYRRKTEQQSSGEGDVVSWVPD